MDAVFDFIGRYDHDHDHDHDHNELVLCAPSIGPDEKKTKLPLLAAIVAMYSIILKKMLGTV